MKRLLLLLSLSQVQLQASFTLHLKDKTTQQINQEFVNQSSVIKGMVEDFKIQPNNPEELLPVFNNYVTAQTIGTLKQLVGKNKHDVKEIAQKASQEVLAEAVLAADFLGFDCLQRPNTGKLVNALIEVLAEKLLTQEISPQATSLFEELQDINGSPTVDFLKNTSLRRSLVEKILSKSSAINYATLSPDGSQIAIAGPCPDHVHVNNSFTGEQLLELTIPGIGAYSVEFNTTGDKIVTTSGDETIRIWDAITGTELKKFKSIDYSCTTEMPSTAYDAQFNPDGTKIAAIFYDQSVCIFDWAQGQRLTKTLHRKKVNSARFSPDGTTIVTASDDGGIYLVTAETGAFSKKGSMHEKPVKYAEFSPDGTKIVTACADGTVTIFTSDCIVKKIIQAHTQQVNVAKFNSDGTMIMSASEGGTAKLWNTATGNLIFAEEFNWPIKQVSFKSLGKNSVAIRCGDRGVVLLTPLDKEKAEIYQSYSDIYHTPLAQVVEFSQKRVTWRNFPEEIQVPLAELEELALSPDEDTL